MKASAYIKARMNKGICKADAEAEARDLIADGLEDDAGLSGVPASRVVAALKDAGLEDDAALALAALAVEQGVAMDDGSMAPATADAATAAVDEAAGAAQEAEDQGELPLDQAEDDMTAKGDGEGTEPRLDTEGTDDNDEDEMKKEDLEEMLKGFAGSIESACVKAFGQIATAIEKGNAANAAALKKASDEIAEVRKGIGTARRPEGTAPSAASTKPAPGDTVDGGVTKGQLSSDDRAAIYAKAHQFKAMQDPGVQKAVGSLAAACEFGSDAEVRRCAAELKITHPAL